MKCSTCNSHRVLSRGKERRRRYRPNCTMMPPLNSSDIGAVPRLFATKLGENYVHYISRVTTNFHAQRPAHRAKVTPNGFITNAPHPRVRRASRGTRRVPPSRVMTQEVSMHAHVQVRGRGHDALASVTTRRRWGYCRHVYHG